MRIRSHLAAAIIVLIAASPVLAGQALSALGTPAGIVLAAEPDALDPMLIWFDVEWQEGAPSAGITVLAPFSTQLVGSHGQLWTRTLDDPGPDTVKHVLATQGVEAGDRTRFMLDLRDAEEGATLIVVAQRVFGRTIYQSQVGIDVLAEGPRVSAPASYRLTDIPKRFGALAAADDPWLAGGEGRPSVDPLGGTVVVESLDPKVATHAEFFQQDNVNMAIPDGPFNCADSNSSWHIIRDIYVSSVPNETVSALTLHVSVTHPDTSDLQMGYFYYGTVGVYLWRHGSGVNIDRDFTTDAFMNALPGIGQPVNNNYRVTVRDCYAGDTGTFNYWTLRIEYGGGGGCAYSISPSSVSLPSGGGSGSVSVTAGSGCAWSATSNSTWITITSGSNGSGNGSVGYSVASNSGGSRSGTLTVAGQTFTVNQDAGGGGGGTCTPNATTLCLSNDRFQVQVNWTTNQPSSGVGQGVELTSDTGYFWFFNQNNVEMVIKVLDGCGVNGNYWVFAGGLTNVQVSMTVTDTAHGTTKSYTNPLGTQFQPIQDTGAFSACP